MDSVNGTYNSTTSNERNQISHITYMHTLSITPSNHTQTHTAITFTHTLPHLSATHTRIHTIKSQSIDERRRLYVQGGVMFVAARMVVVDMLLNRLPPHLVCIIEFIHMYSWALPRTIH